MASNKLRWIVGGLVAFALLGFLDSSYLTAEHVRGVIPPCAVVSGCEQVLTSAYATIIGIPVSVLGMFYYGTLLVLMIAFFDTRDPRILKLAGWATLGGFLGTLYFLFIQAFILHSFCLYCLGSAGTSSILFILGILLVRDH